MTKLKAEELVYLLYADSYLEAGTVKKSTVKSHLPDEWKGKSEKIYDALHNQELIKASSKGRFSVTEQGGTALVTHLATTDYRFDSIKGPKVLNTLLKYIRKAAESHPPVKLSKDMSFDEFQNEFKTLYFKERKKQSLQGVVAIRRREISKDFMEHNSIPEEQFEKYFEMLKDKGEISITEGREDEIIEWVE